MLKAYCGGDGRVRTAALAPDLLIIQEFRTAKGNSTVVVAGGGEDARE